MSEMGENAGIKWVSIGGGGWGIDGRKGAGIRWVSMGAALDKFRRT